MFSVVVPVYNHQKYLAAALYSCLFSPLVTEILVVDDGSCDGSIRIIDYFAAQYPGKVRVLTETPSQNLGAHARLNQLSEAASNKWISVLNSDDRFASGRFEALRHVIRIKHPDFIFGNLVIIDGDEKQIGAKHAGRHLQYPVFNKINLWDATEGDDWLPVALNQNIGVTTSNFVFTKELFYKIGGFRQFRYVYDWDFLLRAIALGRAIFSPQMVTFYRIHSENTIKENLYATETEVVELFSNVLVEANELIFSNSLPAGRRTALERAVRGNVSLNRGYKNALTAIVPAGAQDELKNLAESMPASHIVNDLSEVNDPEEYIYIVRSTKNGNLPRMIS